MKNGVNKNITPYFKSKSEEKFSPFSPLICAFPQIRTLFTSLLLNIFILIKRFSESNLSCLEREQLLPVLNFIYDALDLTRSFNSC